MDIILISMVTDMGTISISITTNDHISSQDMIIHDGIYIRTKIFSLFICQTKHKSKQIMAQQLAIYNSISLYSPYQYVVNLKEGIYLKVMNFNFLPHPPNSAWLPPIDPNDEQTLEQEQAMIEQQFKNILSQDLTGALGTLQLRQEQQEQEEEQEADDIDDYTDEIQIPEGQEQI